MSIWPVVRLAIATKVGASANAMRLKTFLNHYSWAVAPAVTVNKSNALLNAIHPPSVTKSITVAFAVD